MAPTVKPVADWVMPVPVMVCRLLLVRRVPRLSLEDLVVVFLPVGSPDSILMAPLLPLPTPGTYVTEPEVL